MHLDPQKFSDEDVVAEQIVESKHWMIFCELSERLNHLCPRKRKF
jgi:hypothetical protein